MSDDQLADAPTVQMPHEDGADARPVMSHSEASFHRSVADGRAVREAGKSGGDAETAQALGEAAAGGKRIGSVVFHRPSAYSAHAIPAANKLFESLGIEYSAMDSKGLFLYCFVEPKRAYQLAQLQADKAAADEMLKLARQVTLDLEDPDLIDAAESWCMETFNRLHGVKKQPAGEAVETPNPPAPQTPTIAMPRYDDSGSPATVTQPGPDGSSAL